jgi:hypothetical protein
MHALNVSTIGGWRKPHMVGCYVYVGTDAAILHRSFAKRNSPITLNDTNISSDLTHLTTEAPIRLRKCLLQACWRCIHTQETLSYNCQDFQNRFQLPRILGGGPANLWTYEYHVFCWEPPLQSKRTIRLPAMLQFQSLKIPTDLPDRRRRSDPTTHCRLFSSHIIHDHQISALPRISSWEPC